MYLYHNGGLPGGDESVACAPKLHLNMKASEQDIAERPNERPSDSGVHV